MHSQRFDFTDFTRIRIERALSVDILRADAYSVTIGDDFSRIRMEKISDTLCIERRGIDWIAPFHARPHIVITMPLLREITLGGACHSRVIGFQSNNDFGVKLTGACQLEINTISAGNFVVEIVGASNLSGDINYSGNAAFKIVGASRAVLQGSGNTADIELSGASQAKLSNLALHRVNLKCFGASSAQLRVSDNMNVTLVGASRLEYIGNPVIGQIQIAGASTINHR
jgi:hypothetical protein